MILSTPLGEMFAAAEDGALVGLDFVDPSGEPVPSSTGHAPLFEQLRAELDRYFRGEVVAFQTPVRLAGASFHRQVWEALRAIPHGQTRTYADVARTLGKPTASRAVGQANARNPVAILVPCHRVIGVRGNLRGYAGGLDRKARLLAIERGERLLFAG